MNKRYVIITVAVLYCITTAGCAPSAVTGGTEPSPPAGSVDLSFDPFDGTPINSGIHTIAVQDDGTIAVGGDFTLFDGETINRITRLTDSGMLDENFTPMEGANELVRCLVAQPDGKILVGGDFTSFGGVGLNYLTRVQSSGYLDPPFTPLDGFNSFVYDMVVQTDGKIIVAGQFTTYQGGSYPRLVRINTDASIDATFSVGAGVNNYIRSIAVQSDGKILIGGMFTSCQGNSSPRIARLNANGSFDSTFISKAEGQVADIVVQSDNKIVITGEFTAYNGIARRGITRLNSDGSLDTTFDPGSGFDLTYADDMVLQSDGKLVVIGGFSSYDGTARRSIVRINPNGEIDSTFDPGTGPDYDCLSIALQTDGKILVGGYFHEFNGVTRNGIARLYP